MSFNKQILMMILSFSFQANAEWLCTEASSQLIGQTLTTCGVGVSQKEQDARVVARQNAIKEFHALCAISSTCSEREVQITPMRMECKNDGGIYTCYHAISFQMQDTLKREDVVDIDLVNRQITERTIELDRLNLELQKMNQIEEIKAKILEKQKSLEGKNLTDAEKVRPDAIKFEEYKYTNLLYHHSIKLDVGYIPMHISDRAEKDAEIGLAYEYRPFENLAFQFRYGFGTDFQSGAVRSASEVPANGTANSTASSKGPMTFSDISIAPVIYTGVSGFYFKPEYGIIQSSRQSYTTTYGALGTKTGTTTDKASTNVSYLAASIGWDSRKDYKGIGGFVEAGARKVQGGIDSAIVPQLSAGVTFGF